MSHDIKAGPLPAAAPDGEIHPGPLRPASEASDIRPGPLAPASEDAEIHPGPLHRAVASEIQPGSLQPAPADAEIHPGPLPRSGEADVPRGSLEDLRAERNVAAPVRIARDWRPKLAAFAGVATTFAKAAVARRLQAVSKNPAEPAGVPAKKYKKTWREQRWERRRKRLVFEEVMGWVLVPVILIGLYIGVKGLLSALGTTPTALIQGIQTALSNRAP